MFPTKRIWQTQRVFDDASECFVLLQLDLYLIVICCALCLYIVYVISLYRPVKQQLWRSRRQRTLLMLLLLMQLVNLKTSNLCVTDHHRFTLLTASLSFEQ